MTKRDRMRGCLLGGAVGDALGAPVEFLSRGEIFARYGPGGIREMDVAYGVRGAITDDTQMTLWTAEGLIRAQMRGSLRGVCVPADMIAHAYQRWLATQGESARSSTVHEYEPDEMATVPEGWLFGIEGLHRRRAPGTTCLSALRESHEVSAPALNDSKGCGAVMRVAPVGLLTHEPYALGCDSGRVTHGHPLGWISAGVFAWLIAEVFNGSDLRDALHRFCRSPRELANDAHSVFNNGRPADEGAALEELGQLLQQTVRFAESEILPHEGIARLGEGWVAEEALAIAIFCALRFEADLEGGLITSVNHSGDSDSTGSMAG